MLKQSGRSRPASLGHQSETCSSALGSRTSTAATSPASTASVSDAANPASFTGALSDKDAVRRGFDPSILVTSWRPDFSRNLTEMGAQASAVTVIPTGNVGETLRRLLLQVCLPFAERGKPIHSRAM